MKFNPFLGITAASAALAVMVIASELSEPFKSLLKAAFTHHWIGKLVITSLIFVAIGFGFGKKKAGENAAFCTFWGSLLVILVFFVVEFLGGGE